MNHDYEKLASIRLFMVTGQRALLHKIRDKLSTIDAALHIEMSQAMQSLEDSYDEALNPYYEQLDANSTA